MCGIVGVFGAVDYKLEKVLSLMWIMDSVRGWHSSGLAAVKIGGEVVVEKCLGSPHNLQGKSQIINDLKSPYKSTYNALIAHNRHATVGNVTIENAHPFEVGSLVGVHNGTLEMKESDLEKDGHEVDSHTLFQNISKLGLREAISKTKGAWSIVYYDKNEERVNLIRNDKRPMYWTLTKDKRALLVASEPWMITCACYRYGVEINKPQETKENYIYWWNVENLRLNHNKELEFFKSKTVAEGKKYQYKPPANVQNKNVSTHYDSFNIRNRFLSRMDFFTDDEGYVGFELDLSEEQKKDLTPYLRQKPIPLSIMGMNGYSVKINCNLMGAPDSDIREKILTEVEKPIFFGKINSTSILWSGTTPQINIVVQGNSILPDFLTEVEYFRAPPVATGEEEDDKVLNKVGAYFLSSKQLKELVDCGCENCRGDISETELRNEAAVTVWQNDVGGYSALCKDCKSLIN